VLTIDFSGVTTPVGAYQGLLLARQLNFDGGAGAKTDEVRLQHNPPGWWLDEFVFGISAINDWSHVVVDALHLQATSMRDGYFSAACRQVELITQPFGTYSEIGLTNDGINAIKSNVITVDQNRSNGMALVRYVTAGVSIQLFPQEAFVHGGPGDDRISIVSAPTEDGAPVVNVDGSDGNDTIIGSRGSDAIDGGKGDDLIEGGAGNDTLTGNLGNDTVHGGSGHDMLKEFASVEWWLEDMSQISEFVLKQNSMTGLGNDVLSRVESADIWIIGRVNFDASAFAGSVSLRGYGYDDTLIGGSGDDTLNGDGGADLLIGGKGNDVLVYPDGWNNSGEAGVDTLCGGPGNDEYQIQSPELQPVIIDDEKELRAYLVKSTATETTTVVTIDPVSATVTTDVSAATIASAPANDATPNDNDLIPIQVQAFLVASPNDVLLIGQGIATVGIEDRELSEFDTARSDSAFGELADSEPEEGDALAANGDTNSADVGEELELDAMLSNDFLVSLAETLPN
jgi:hypothetical protein